MSLSTHEIQNQKYVKLKIEKKWSKLKQNNNKNNNCSISNFTEKFEFDLNLWNHLTTRQPPCGVGGPIRQRRLKLSNKLPLQFTVEIKSLIIFIHFIFIK
ncbi:hypothetical protein QL285_016062 [Trifolium repens]|nr:hypothetical protein QL285_016062 [Trifolium repens]